MADEHENTTTPAEQAPQAATQEASTTPAAPAQAEAPAQTEAAESGASDTSDTPAENAPAAKEEPAKKSAPAKPHAPSPAAFAKKPASGVQVAVPSAVAYTDEQIKDAERFGRVDDSGTVFVKEGNSEREVGQFPDAPKEEALALYARRFLDLKAKLDTLDTRLKTTSIKSREIDE